MNRKRSVRRTPNQLITAIAVASGIAGAFAGAAPTGNSYADAFWSFLVGATLARATVDARRWTWFPMAGVAATVAEGWLALLCGVGSLGLVFAAGFFTRRRRWIGALVGALAAQALLRGYSYGFTGLPTIVAFAACTPLLISAYRNAAARTKTIARSTAAVGVVVMGVLTIFTAVSALSARDHIAEAIRFGDQAVDAAEDGEQDLAASFIGASAEELDAVASDFRRPWLYPARFVPILGPHAAVLGDVADAGATVADDAADVLVALDPEAIIQPGGQIDMEALQDVVGPMGTLDASLSEALVDIDDLDSTWLYSAAQERVDELVEELETTSDTVDTANELVAIAPGMLGADEPRRYLIVFTTPSEARGSGGFAGNWAELVVDNGDLTLVDAGRGDDINQALPPFGINVPADLRSLYDGFELQTTFQNVPVVPNYPTVASLARFQFEAAFDRDVDAVIGVDHAGIGGVVQLTGPVEVNGTTMNANQIEEFVLRGQYEAFGDDEEARLQALDDLTFEVFDQLVNAELPSPATIVDVFEPLIEGNHVRVVSFDNAEAVALDRVGLSGSFPVAAGQDLVGVVTQNLGENKIDIFLEREISYRTVVEADTGVAQSVLTIALTNNAPAEGLPDAIIGNNDQGLPFGTNKTRVQIYTRLDVDSATLDGLPIDFIAEEELGWVRHRRDLWLDAGQTEVIEVQLAGLVDLTEGYVLHVDHQPLANNDVVNLEVSIEGKEKIQEVFGLEASGRAKVDLDSDHQVGVVLDG